VRPGHPWHGVDEQTLHDVDVHGGLTSNGPTGHVRGLPAEPADAWWLGFDCGHVGDASPTRAYAELEYRTFGYVRSEVEKLAARAEHMAKASVPALTATQVTVLRSLWEADRRSWFGLTPGELSVALQSLATMGLVHANFGHEHLITVATSRITDAGTRALLAHWENKRLSRLENDASPLDEVYRAVEDFASDYAIACGAERPLGCNDRGMGHLGHSAAALTKAVEALRIHERGSR
jgi:hypothetical protein